MAQPGADPLSALNVGSLRIGPHRIIQHANDAVAAWTGRSVDSLVGGPLAGVLTTGSLLLWEAAVEPVLEAQGHAWDVALDLQPTTGPPVTVLVNARRAGDGTDCVLFPFSQRRQHEHRSRAAEARARRQENEIARLQGIDAFRRDFINMAAHELATPMTPLRIALEFLEKSIGDDAGPRTRRALDVMRANLAKLTRLSASLVASADIEAGRIGVRLERVALRKTLPTLVESWRKAYAPERRIEVTAGDELVQADLTALSTCLGQLLENAVKFSPATTPVTVRSEPGPPVCIVVEDQGRGIAPERLAELGRPFAQAHDRAEFTALGAGLGLHIVGGLMNAQGGRLTLHSAGRGHGTRAVLEFRSAAKKEDDAPGAPAVTPRAAPAQETTLSGPLPRPPNDL